MPSPKSRAIPGPTGGTRVAPVTSVPTPRVGIRGQKSVAASARSAALRHARRRLAAGFTLVELMVVVILVAVLAMIAVPALSTSRADRLAFDYARQIQGLITRARARAAGRGAAHLIVAAPSGVRGKVLLFEALDAATPGPNPVGSCKLPNQWLEATTFTPGTIGMRARIIDGLDLDAAGVNTSADIRADFSLDSVATPAWAMCITPNGTTYVGVGGAEGAAITDMQSRTPFTGVLEARVTRNRAGAPIGIRRRVIATGTAAPRVRSE